MNRTRKSFGTDDFGVSESSRKVIDKLRKKRFAKRKRRSQVESVEAVAARYSLLDTVSFQDVVVEIWIFLS